MLPGSELAAAAVAALAPYLATAAKEGAKKLGGAAAEHLVALYEKVKTHLTSPLGKAAIAAVERAPEKPDAQATLRLALETAIEENPAFGAELAKRLEALGPLAPSGITQTSIISGTDNVSTQIAGSGNEVQVGGGLGRKSP
jgi:hypothetical protein